MIPRIRKAVTAALGAGISVALGALVVAGSLGREQVAKAVAAGVAAAITVGLATWRIPNAR